MTVKYGFLNYNEPKKFSQTETPKTTFSFNINELSDVRSSATALSNDVYENLNGKTKFRFYATDGKYTSVYQVDFTKESRDFFESEIADDLRTFLGK